MTIRKGDRVRVVLEDTVRAVRSDGTEIVLGPYGEANLIDPQAEHVKSVEVIERRTYQVGDVIESRRELGQLPERSVVVNWFGSPMIVHSAGTTSALGKHTPFGAGVDNAPYRVVHIPAR